MRPGAWRATRSAGSASRRPRSACRAIPHQLSGGMRQRVAIAIALLHDPDLIIADEPTTALDVTIQGQILFEMQKLTRETGTALIWITHDLSVVAGLADDIAVMYAGRIVETGPVDAVLDGALHPYTNGLIGSVPSRNRRGAPLQQIPGMTPSLLALPEGCAFRTRCTPRRRCLPRRAGVDRVAHRARTRAAFTHISRQRGEPADRPRRGVETLREKTRHRRQAGQPARRRPTRGGRARGRWGEPRRGRGRGGRAGRRVGLWQVDFGPHRRRHRSAERRRRAVPRPADRHAAARRAQERAAQDPDDLPGPRSPRSTRA